MIPSKFEPVYSFQTDKDYRRLCLSEFSYMQYWMRRNEARQDQRLEIESDQLPVTEPKDPECPSVVLVSLLVFVVTTAMLVLLFI